MTAVPAPSPVLLEVCVDCAEGLKAALEGGADRVELCAALEVGGLTPSVGLMRLAVESGALARAMIRPRSGAFVFSAAEVDLMLHDIDAARAIGLEGVVIGASTARNDLDIAALDRLARHARGMGVTLHRAVDLTPDPLAAVDIAMGLGIDTILTSGGAPAAIDGAPMISAMNRAAAGRLTIMAGGGLTAETVGSVIDRTGVRAVHGSFSRAWPAANPRAVELGFTAPSVRITDPSAVAMARGVLASRSQPAGAGQVSGPTS
jgi:copper homeostasis protein